MTFNDVHDHVRRLDRRFAPETAAGAIGIASPSRRQASESGRIRQPPAHLVATLSAGVGALTVAVIANPMDVLARVQSAAWEVSDPWKATGGALLLAASAVAWILALWCLLVLAVGVGVRIPGAVGRVSRQLLGWVTPVGVRRAVLVAVGCSVAAGAAACGPSSPAPASPSSMPAAVTMTKSTAPTPVPNKLSHPPASTETIDLDWPLSSSGVGPVAGPVDDSGGTVDRDTTRGDPSTVSAESSGTTRPAPPVAVRGPSAAAPEASRSAAPAARPSVAAAPSTRAPEAPMEASTAESTEASTTAAHRRADRVIVHRGDTLWSIAAAHLPASATDVEIDAEWRAWYAANRRVIGEDPDLLLPGQHLEPPHRKGHHA